MTFTHLPPSLLVRRFCFVLALLVCATPASALAQATPRAGRVRGVVIDSLLGAYLSGARVQLTPSARTTTSDSTGRFVFDSVPAGNWILGFSHPALDSIAEHASPVAIRVFSGASTSVTLATHSFASARAPICGDTPDSLSPTVAHGRVHTLDDQRIKVDVGVSWVSVDASTRPGTVRTISDGGAQSWSACGAPWGSWIHVFVRDSTHTASAYLQIGARGIAVRDLVIGTGTRPLRGVVYDVQGQPVPGAVVMVVGTSLRAVADPSGAFVIDGAPKGTITVDARAAGHRPVLVATADTMPLKFVLPALYEADDDAPRGSDYLRLLERNTRPGVAIMAGAALQGETSLEEIIPSAACVFWLDGRSVSRDFFFAQPKHRWLAIELYAKGADAPPEYRRERCPTVLLWTSTADW